MEEGNEVSTDAIYSFTVEGDRVLVANLELVTAITVKEKNGDEMVVYPNPVRDYLIIEWDNFSYATLRSISGQKLMDNVMKTLDLSTVKSGPYLLILKGKDDQLIQYKIIKE